MTTFQHRDPAASRAEAVRWAEHARAVRMSARADLRAGELTLQEMFDRAHSDETWGRIKILWVLESLPGAQKVTTRRTLDSMSIDGAVAVSDLTSSQVADLLKVFDT